MNKSNNNKPVIGISVGDINGIGPEVILKTFRDQRIYNYCTPVVFGCKNLMNYYIKLLKIKDIHYNLAKNLQSIYHKKLNLYCDFSNETDLNIEVGKSTESGGAYAYKSLKSAVSALKEGLIDALVTAPINKFNIQSDEFQYPGHTEYLKTEFGAEANLMIMATDELKIAVQTGHIPIKDISAALDKDEIIRTLELFSNSLNKDFGVRKPKLAVLGLNPHAGDEGLLGSEEKEIIEPALAEAREKGLLVMGPYPADGFFGSQMEAKFDGVLAMYHDQGLIPFKSLTFDSGVNYTAGLSIVRTSPSHGTGFGIAGKNIANPNSFREAVFMAAKILDNRQLHAEISSNPLKTKVVREKEEDD